MALPQNMRRSFGKQAEHMLKTGSRFDRYDQIRERHFWSTWRIVVDANGYIQSQRLPFFSGPAGQNIQGFNPITDRETNWAGANRVPDNQNLEIKELGISIEHGNALLSVFRPNAAGALQTALLGTYKALIEHFVVDITYLTNTVPLGWASDFAQASAPHIGHYKPHLPSTPTPDLAANVFVSNGFPSPSLRRRFRIPILLGHGETFTFGLSLPRSVFTGLAAQSYFDVRFEFWAIESFVEKS